MKLPSTLVLIFGLANLLYGQEFRYEQKNRFVSHYTPQNTEFKARYKIDEVTSVTSISIQFIGDLTGSSVIADGKKYPLYPDEHATGDFKESALVIFDEPVSNIEVFADKDLKKLHRITAIHSPRLTNLPLRTMEDFDCSMPPEMVSQSSWRSGLPDPSNSRSYTTTRNIIVHHSATSNNLTDYTNVVRNIYLFHTQDRGWSDVGYNYLIAPDGTIYAGRDPLQGEQDLVMGAHFCARNSNTMGICLLGNLSLTEPADDALQSLEKLIAWKVTKDELDAEGVNAHPLNSSLPVIAGHRDGCPTQCPGNFTYPRLSQIRMRVASLIDQCMEEPEVPEERSFAVGPNPSTFNRLNISLPENVFPSDVKLINMNGQRFALKITYYNIRSMQLDLSSLPTGMYILSINTEDFKTTQKLIKK